MQSTNIKWTVKLWADSSILFVQMQIWVVQMGLDMIHQVIMLIMTR